MEIRKKKNRPCPDCGEDDPAQFGRDRYRADHLRTYCRACCSIRGTNAKMRWRQTHPDYMTHYMQQWRAEHRDHYNAYHRAYHHQKMTTASPSPSEAVQEMTEEKRLA